MKLNTTWEDRRVESALVKHYSIEEHTDKDLTCQEEYHLEGDSDIANNRDKVGHPTCVFAICGDTLTEISVGLFEHLKQFATK